MCFAFIKIKQQIPASNKFSCFLKKLRSLDELIGSGKTARFFYKTMHHERKKTEKGKRETTLILAFCNYIIRLVQGSAARL